MKKWPVVSGVIIAMLAMLMLAWRASLQPANKLDSPSSAQETKQSRAQADSAAGAGNTTTAMNPRSRPSHAPPARVYPKPKIPVAEPIADKPGFVMSPFNGKVIDVRDIPPGTLVADPTYPAAEMKYFRLPK